MLRLYAPVAVTVVLIAGLTYWEGIYSDRFVSSSVDAAEFGKRFAKVPSKIGDWVGEDRPEDAATLEVAGAVSHVSRRYVNSETTAKVDLWLIVGHARDVCRHTPDICYPSHGFAQLGNTVKQRIEVPGEEPATFFTAKFRDESEQGGEVVRVFWAWNGNRPDKDQDDWEAPDYQKQHFGNNRALYKMYFTASMKDKDEPVSDNAAIEFGKLMIPVVNRALFPERYAGKPAPPAAESASEDAAPAATEPVAAESPAAAPETSEPTPFDPAAGGPAAAPADN